MSCPLNIVSSGHWIKHEKPEEQLDEVELYIYSRNDKFVVFCSVALHYRIQRTFSHDCIRTLHQI